MRVCFLLHELGRAGGMNVIAGHVERLAARPGWHAQIVLTSELDQVADVEWDFALATWWETAPALWRLNARRRGVFLQSLEERFYGDRDVLARLGAASVLGLPVDYVTIGDWMRDALAELRPDARCVVVRNGIDKTVFAPPAAPRRFDDGPLRVLVEGNPGMWLKAVPEAIEAAKAMTSESVVTVVAAEPERAEGLGADRVAGGLDAAGMAALYAEHDVLLKLSRVEGVALPPLEAMHVGTPCVVTPHTGHEEYVRHGVNGLVVGFDDPGAATAALDALARDRELLARLSQGALATATAWPNVNQSTDQLAAALENLADAPPPAVEPALAALFDRQRLAIEVGRAELGKVTWFENAYEQAKQTLVDVGEQHERELAEIREERAYRAAVRARGIVQKVTRRGD
jgi:glycosyltransferase involved in cell wall biosynthesis